jgi:hypothetical protein
MNAKLGIVGRDCLADMGARSFGQTGDAAGIAANPGLAFSQEPVHYPVLMPEELEEMRG